MSDINIDAKSSYSKQTLDQQSASQFSTSTGQTNNNMSKNAIINSFNLGYGGVAQSLKNKKENQKQAEKVAAADDAGDNVLRQKSNNDSAPVSTK